MIDVARRIAFAALLPAMALGCQGVTSVTPAANAHTAVPESGVAVATARDLPKEQHALPAVIWAPPVRLQIPSLKVDAQVEALGVDNSGAMETPRNVWNVGWYRAGPSPGAPGDAVIDGHVGLPGAPLVFARLGTVAIGADVVAVLADGTRSRFSVSDIQSWPATSQPSGLFRGDGLPRLSLITCTGAYDRRSQNYADRLIVEAIYVGPA